MEFSAGYYDVYYLKALNVRRMIRRDLDAAFERCDVHVSPIAPTPAFRMGELVNEPLAMCLSDIDTISANLAGSPMPGLSLPCGLSSTGLPITLQLLAAPFEEEILLRTARMFERVPEWHRKRPIGT